MLVGKLLGYNQGVVFLSKYLEDLQQRTYKRQRTILYQGEIPKAVYIIKKGVVRAYNILENGEERVIELLGEGDIVAANWILGNSKATLYYYDAFTDVTFFLMPRDVFESYLVNTEFSRHIIHSLSKRYSASTMHANALLQTYASAKIAQGLQFLVLSSSKKLPDGTCKITIRLTHQDLANLVGVTRETAALELNKLKDKKIISYTSFTYTVNYEALIRLGGGDEFIGLSI